jgi:hypothetical protein
MLRGDISAANFVRMTADELATKVGGWLAGWLCCLGSERAWHHGPMQHVMLQNAQLWHDCICRPRLVCTC